MSHSERQKRYHEKRISAGESRITIYLNASDLAVLTDMSEDMQLTKSAVVALALREFKKHRS